MPSLFVSTSVTTQLAVSFALVLKDIYLRLTKGIAQVNSNTNRLADLATERERHLTTGKRAKTTKLDFRCPICRSAIGQASCLICARRRQLTFPFRC